MTVTFIRLWVVARGPVLRHRFFVWAHTDGLCAGRDDDQAFSGLLWHGLLDKAKVIHLAVARNAAIVPATLSAAQHLFCFVNDPLEAATSNGQGPKGLRPLRGPRAHSEELSSGDSRLSITGALSRSKGSSLFSWL